MKHHAAGFGSGGRIEKVEPNFFFLPEDKGSTPQDNPYPKDDTDLIRPADRKVQNIAEYYLQDEGCEHQCQHDGEQVFRTAV